MRLFGLPVPAQLPQVIDRVGADRRGASLHADVLGSQEPLACWRGSIGVPRSTVDEVLQQAGPRRPGQGALRHLLARHEAAAGHRRGAAEEPRPADPRRADQRARPGRHPRDPRADPRPRRVRGHRAAELAHPRGGPAGVPLGLDRRRRPAARDRTGRGPARRERLAHARRRHRPARAHGTSSRRRATPSHAQGDLLVVEGHEHPEEITKLLAGKGVYVSELSAIRPTLESFFLKLTGRPQRADAAADGGRAAAPRRGGLLMRLLAVELNRFRSRRAIALLVARGGRARRRAGRDHGLADPAADRDRPRRRRCAGRPRGQEAGDPGGGRSPATRHPRTSSVPRRLPTSARTRWSRGPSAYYPRDTLSLRTGPHHPGARACRSRSSWSA